MTIEQRPAWTGRRFRPALAPIGQIVP